jgi:hypothetical protein
VPAAAHARTLPPFWQSGAALQGCENAGLRASSITVEREASAERGPHAAKPLARLKPRSIEMESTKACATIMKKR